MRIGISGAQGTGKTTLFRALRATGILSDHTWIESGIRQLAKQYGLTLNEDSNDFAQMTIMNHFALNALVEDNLVSDRTPLDCLTYTHLLWRKQQVSTTAYAEVRQMFSQTQCLYDLNFYLSPEFPIEAREMRSNSVEFQQEFCRTLDALVHENQTVLIPLSGSVDDRVYKACLTIEALQPRKDMCAELPGFTQENL